MVTRNSVGAAKTGVKSRAKSLKMAEVRVIVDKIDYKLTIERLIELLTEVEPQQEEARYRNRVTKEPMRLSGRNTFHKAIGFPSTGSLSHFANARKAGKDWSRFQPSGLFGIWAFIQLIEDRQGKGLIDPIDPDRREIRELFPDYRDLMKLQCESAPDWKEVAEFEELDPAIVRALDRALGSINPIEELYEKIKAMSQKEALTKLRKMIALYRDDHDLSSNEEVAEMMMINRQTDEATIEMKTKLIRAIGDIYQKKLPAFDDFNVAIIILADHLQGFEGEGFSTIGELLNYVGWIVD